MRTHLDLDPVGSALDCTRRLWAEHATYVATGPVRLGEFTARTSGDTVIMSARIHGGTARESLVQFAQQVGGYFAEFRAAGDLVPVLDVDEPGREAVVWCSGGVWVELWVPTEPGGRLPSGRRVTTTA